MLRGGCGKNATSALTVEIISREIREPSISPEYERPDRQGTGTLVRAPQDGNPEATRKLRDKKIILASYRLSIPHRRDGSAGKVNDTKEVPGELQNAGIVN